ncbi:protein FRIGIDA-like isoform X1 [Nicotiana tabacum]|uniref:FRIGIDA-like protein n=2 Tax=Nicotiana TaxID=4085 RepID=A0A1S4BIH5_TOBAC|nr:PREDICTED: protein FRIGIDA-like isoform X1 [Nicotiana sylvestris]
MAKPADTAAAATPQSQQTLNDSLQNVTKQSEFQQPPTHSQDDSISNLRKLTDSLSAFQRCFADLYQHIDSIRTIIDSMLPPLTTNTTPLPTSLPPPAPAAEPEPSWESDPSEEEVEGEGEGEEKEKEEEVKSPPHPELKSAHLAELESLCKMMSGRHLRRYMGMHLSDIKGLLEQVPKALRLSPNPARLVLECVGKFYSQKGSVFVKYSHMVRSRLASVLVLECFLLMGINDEIEKGVKQEAERAALAWRKRLIAEGGVLKAKEIDARGLLMLIACFGIPGGFRNEDIRDLLQVSCIKRYYRALRRSNVLVAKIPEIIEGMLKQKMEVDAVHIAYTFGFEDRFNPQRLLTSFLLDTKESLKKMKENSHGSHAAVNEAKRKHLFALKYLIKCLERHDTDPSKLLPGWQINEQIMKLEKEIVELDKQTGGKMAQKRKRDETESSRRFRNKEAKRSRIPPWLWKQRVVNHVDSDCTLLERQNAGHVHGYTVSSSVLHGPVAGSMHENVVGSLAGTVAMGRDGAGISASVDGIQADISEGMEIVHQGASYAGGHGGTLVDRTPGQIGIHTGQSYGWRGNAAVYDGLASCSYAYRPSSYVEGSTGLPNSQPSDPHRSPPYLESSAGLPNATHSDAYRPPPYLEGSAGLPNATHSDAYRPPPYLEGSAGLPNAIPGDVASRSSASDIYQVADTVTANELYRSRGSGAVDVVSSAASAHPSPYLYWPR